MSIAELQAMPTTVALTAYPPPRMLRSTPEPRVLSTPTVLLFDGATARAYPVESPLVVGRGARCAISLRDRSASRAHAQISVSRGEFVVVDLESRNGICVNGVPVTHYRLRRGWLRVADRLLYLAHLTDPWFTEARDPRLLGGPALSQTREAIALAGPRNTPVLLHGEPGTGKKTVARLLHERSGRDGPFLGVSCATRSGTEIERELFGPPDATRRGLVHAAARGTLFLEDVGDLPSFAQIRLHHLIRQQERDLAEGAQPHSVGPRVIASTSRRLEHEELFTTPLHIQLAKMRIDLPPLRDRPEDIPLLVAAQLARLGLREVTIEPDALEALVLHPWPMNVRELKQVLRDTTRRQAHALTLSALPPRVAAPVTQRWRATKRRPSLVAV